jgi:cell division control protein 7
VRPSHWVSPNGARPGVKKPHYVAIKKIYVTSSPIRIQNELQLLYDLRGCHAVCPIITAFRDNDQVVAVLPYYRHHDFREFFRHMLVDDMRTYFRQLFFALEAIHSHNILHRDIKPTNFLYDAQRQRGVLVDFGLAEREEWDTNPCICTESSASRKSKIDRCYAGQHPGLGNGYPKNDTRQSRRANRAGTRGFRAPEVLFKCNSQTTKIDVWSAGVILLTIMARRFPFFNSTDDVDAMIEIATIFGRKRMKHCALLHGTVFDCTLETIGEKGHPLEKLIVWSQCAQKLSDEEKEAVGFLERCMELDPRKRLSASEALAHPFLQFKSPYVVDFDQGEQHEEEDEMELVR